MEWSRYNRLFRSERFGPFLYNAMSNTLLELDEEHYRVLEELRDRGNGSCAGADSSFVALLREHKALVEAGEEERLLLSRQYARNALCFDTALLGLTLCPTLQCNFRCPYCFEHSQQDGTVMSPETVARLLTFIQGYKDIRHLSIAWFGGEPLLAFNIIRDITEKVQALDLNFEGASLVTNGYLLDGDKIARLNSLKINSIQITLDGPQGVHDSRRVLAGGGPTFQRILGNVAALMDSPYEGSCAIRVNIDKHNLDRFLELRAALLERFTGKKLSVNAAHVDTSLGDAYDHDCSLTLREWADFTLALHRKGVLLPTGASFYPAGNLDSVCVATMHHGFVIGPEGELYKCWSDVGKPAMIIGNIHAEEPVTNPALRAQYYTGIDAYSDPVCRACDALPICGGGCANRRLRAKKFGEAGLEYCSPYRDQLLPCLEAYYDTFRSKETLRRGAQAGQRKAGRPGLPRGLTPAAEGRQTPASGDDRYRAGAMRTFRIKIGSADFVTDFTGQWWDVCAAVPGCWSSRPWTARSRPGSVVSLPEAFVQIQDAPCLFGKSRISRKNPGAMVPRSDRIFG